MNLEFKTFGQSTPYELPKDKTLIVFSIKDNMKWVGYIDTNNVKEFSKSETRFIYTTMGKEEEVIYERVILLDVNINIASSMIYFP